MIQSPIFEDKENSLPQSIVYIQIIMQALTNILEKRVFLLLWLAYPIGMLLECES